MQVPGDQQRRSRRGETSSRRFRLALSVIALCGVTLSCQSNIDFANLPGKPVCGVEDCGGNATTISGPLMVPALKSASTDAANAWLREGHSLVVGVCRNGECLDDDTIRVGTVSSCSTGNGTFDSCVWLKENGDECEGKTVQTDAMSFLCFVVTSQGNERRHVLLGPSSRAVWAAPRPRQNTPRQPCEPLHETRKFHRRLAAGPTESGRAGALTPTHEAAESVTRCMT